MGNQREFRKFVVFQVALIFLNVIFAPNSGRFTFDIIDTLERVVFYEGEDPPVSVKL